MFTSGYEAEQGWVFITNRCPLSEIFDAIVNQPLTKASFTILVKN